MLEPQPFTFRLTDAELAANNAIIREFERGHAIAWLHADVGDHAEVCKWALCPAVKLSSTRAALTPAVSVEDTFSVGEWVTPADPVAFPSVLGEIRGVEYIHHATTGEHCATYYRVAWQGPGRHPHESQEARAVVLARSAESVSVALF